MLNITHKFKESNKNNFNELARQEDSALVLDYACGTELASHAKCIVGVDISQTMVVVCASSYHHFPSIEGVTKALASYLKPGGSLLVADLMKLSSAESAQEQFPPGAPVAHKGGFDEADIKAAFEGTGLVNFAFVTADKAKQHGHSVQFFLAPGVRDQGS
ncbi:hexaprenyldihydroxybenzoate methyltransferase [Suillus ampliporus]|nr:hexaprenyldihydroxybenzoate methyltransferase [Suillus ampliporus]